MDKLKELLSQLAFVALVAGLIAYVVKFFIPSFPFDAAMIQDFLIFLLSLAGIVVGVRARGRLW